MGFDEPLPDDVRRLLENESPAVMARELLRVRALADSRAWLLVGVAQTAGVKVTIDEVDSGARTLASVHDAAVAGILETRRLAERYLARKDEDIVDGAATAAQIRADRMQAERDEARAEIERLHKIIGIRGSVIMDVARAAGITFNPDEYTRGGRPLSGLAGEAASAICRMRQEREDLVERAVKAEGSTNVLRAALSQLTDQALRAEAEVKRLQATDPTTDLYKTAAHETRQILSAALGAHADGVPITELPRQAREAVSQINAERSRAHLQNTAIGEAQRVLDEAGVAKKGDAGYTLTLWDRVGLLVDERNDARRAAATPAPFVFRREVGGNVVEVRAPTLPDLEAAIAAMAKVP